MASEKTGADAPHALCATYGSSRRDEDVKAIYFVTADAGPGIAPRLVEPFAKLGLVPARIHLSSEDHGGRKMAADLRIAGISQRVAHLIDKALRRVVGVRKVIMLVEQS